MEISRSNDEKQIAVRNWLATSYRISWHADSFAHTYQFVSAKLILVTSSREHSCNSAIFLYHVFYVSRFPSNTPQLSIMASANRQYKTSEIFLVCYCNLRFARLLVGAHWNNGIVGVLRPTQLIQRQNSHCGAKANNAAKANFRWWQSWPFGSGKCNRGQKCTWHKLHPFEEVISKEDVNGNIGAEVALTQVAAKSVLKPTESHMSRTLSTTLHVLEISSTPSKNRLDWHTPKKGTSKHDIE